MAGPRGKYTQASSLLAPNLAQFAIINSVGEDRMAFFDFSQGKWTNLRAGTNLAIVGTDLNVSFALAGFVTGGVIYWDGTNLVNSANFTFDGTTVVIAGSSITSTFRLGNLEEQSVSVNNVMIHNNGYFDGTNFRYRANGFFNQIQYTAGGWAFNTGPSGTAGNIVSYTPVLTIANTTGNSVFAGTVTGTRFIGPVTALKSATTSVDVSAATAPSSGQTLTATSSTTATWQTPTITAIPVTISQGGTNATSFGTTNGLVYYDATRLVNSANLTFDGTIVSVTGKIYAQSANDGTDTLRIGSNSQYFGFARSNTTGNLSIQGSQVGFNNIVLCPTSGNVGIHTTPSATSDLVVYNSGSTSVIEIDAPLATNAILRISSVSVPQWSLYRPASTTDLYLADAAGAKFYFIQTTGQMGIGGTPNANAILDVQSTTKPFMPPRMNTTQMNAVSSPTAGMVIYNSTIGSLCEYTSTWLPLSNIQKAYLTADFSKVNTTLASVTDLTLNLVAGHMYKITIEGVSSSTGTGQCKMDLNGGSATFVTNGLVGSWLITDTSSFTTQRGGALIALTDVMSGSPSVDYGGITITFTIAVNAAGTLIPRYAQNSLDAGNPSLLLKYATITAVDIT